MKKVLKYIVIVVVTGTILSASCKEVEGQSSNEMAVIGEDFVAATITKKYTDDGCGFIVAIEKDGETLLFDPIELKEEFKKEGLVVEIKFHTSRIKQETCLIATPIVIDEIVIK